MKSLDELLEKAKWDKLSSEELNYIVERIKSSTPEEDDDLYTLIHILGKSGNKQYKKIVESFLFYPSSPMIPAIALKTLCTYWGFEDEYLPVMKNFIQGVEWDTDNDVKLVAISCAGQYLKNQNDKELIQSLLSIYQNENEDEFNREGAFVALALATGHDWDEINHDPALKSSVIGEAEQLLV